MEWPQRPHGAGPEGWPSTHFEVVVWNIHTSSVKVTGSKPSKPPNMNTLSSIAVNAQAEIPAGRWPETCMRDKQTWWRKTLTTHGRSDERRGRERWCSTCQYGVGGKP